MRIDADGRSSLPGLYAAGEVAGGLFTSDRFKGTGVMAGLVFGARAGRRMAGEAAGPIERPTWPEAELFSDLRPAPAGEPASMCKSIQSISATLLLDRRDAALHVAGHTLEHLHGQFSIVAPSPNVRHALAWRENLNLLELAERICRAHLE